MLLALLCFFWCVSASQDPIRVEWVVDFGGSDVIAVGSTGKASMAALTSNALFLLPSAQGRSVEPACQIKPGALGDIQTAMVVGSQNYGQVFVYTVTKMNNASQELILWNIVVKSRSSSDPCKVTQSESSPMPPSTHPWTTMMVSPQLDSRRYIIPSVMYIASATDFLVKGVRSGKENVVNLRQMVNGTGVHASALDKVGSVFAAPLKSGSKHVAYSVRVQVENDEENKSVMFMFDFLPDGETLEASSFVSFDDTLSSGMMATLWPDSDTAASDEATRLMALWTMKRNTSFVYSLAPGERLPKKNVLPRSLRQNVEWIHDGIMSVRNDEFSTSGWAVVMQRYERARGAPAVVPFVIQFDNRQGSPVVVCNTGLWWDGNDAKLLDLGFDNRQRGLFGIVVTDKQQGRVMMSLMSVQYADGCNLPTGARDQQQRRAQHTSAVKRGVGTVPAGCSNGHFDDLACDTQCCVAKVSATNPCCSPLQADLAQSCKTMCPVLHCTFYNAEFACCSGEP